MKLKNQFQCQQELLDLHVESEKLKAKIYRKDADSSHYKFYIFFNRFLANVKLLILISSRTYMY